MRFVISVFRRLCLTFEWGFSSLYTALGIHIFLIETFGQILHEYDVHKGAKCIPCDLHGTCALTRVSKSAYFWFAETYTHCVVLCRCVWVCVVVVVRRRLTN